MRHATERPKAGSMLSLPASREVSLLRLFLVVEVIGGHLAMVWLPSYSTLDVGTAFGFLAAAFRMAFRFGPQSAYAFIFLSGFFIVPKLIPIVKSQAESNALSNFVSSRIKRIYPTLVAAICLTFVCDVIGVYALGQNAIYRHTANYDMTEALSIGSGLGNLLSLQPTFIGAFGSNGPLWTLGYLVQFYVAGGVLVYFAKRHVGLGVALLIVLIVTACVWRFEWGLLFILWLGAGCIPKLDVRRSLRWCCATMALVLFVGANLVPVTPSIIAVGLAMTLMVLAFPLGDHGYVSPVTWSYVLVVDRLSFALYAFHFPVIMLVRAGAAASHVTLNVSSILTLFMLSLGIVGVLSYIFEESTRTRGTKVERSK